jgi:hypothetical protein
MTRSSLWFGTEYEPLTETGMIPRHNLRSPVCRTSGEAARRGGKLLHWDTLKRRLRPTSRASGIRVILMNGKAMSKL